MTDTETPPVYMERITSLEKTRPGFPSADNGLEQEPVYEALFRLLAESIDDLAILLLDPEGYVTGWNPGAERLTGYAADEVLGRHCSLLCPEEDAAAGNPEHRLVTAFENGRVEADVRCARKDGTRFWAHFVITAVRDDQGQHRGFLQVTRDLAQRGQAEDLLVQSREQLRNLALRLQSIREEERARIAREIHDVLGQALTVLRIDQGWLVKHLPEEQQQLRALADTITASIDAAIQTVRRIATELRPGILDKLGLAAAIGWQAEEFEAHTGIACTFVSRREHPDLDKDLATALFRIFQEILTNVARHAGATRVHIELRTEGDRLVLVVRDDGRGIRAEQISDPASLGLLGMRERMLPWGGRVDIAGKDGRGTTVTVDVPIHRVQPRRGKG